MKKFLKKLTIFIVMFIICGCSSTSIKEIKYDEFNNLVKENKTFILYIGSESCANCTEFSPKFESVIEENNISDTYYMDLDELSGEDKKSFNKVVNITGTPTVVFITNGEEESGFNRINGNVSKEKIITRLKANDYIK